jgi:hypothetical protein
MAAIERSFALLKQLMGLRRLACWGMEGARAEIGIGVLSYNLARIINGVDVTRLLAELK